MPLHGAQWMLVRVDDRSVDRVDVQRPEGQTVNVCARVIWERVPHAEFVAVCLADERRARGGQQVYDGRVEG